MTIIRFCVLFLSAWIFAGAGCAGSFLKYRYTFECLLSDQYRPNYCHKTYPSEHEDCDSRERACGEYGSSEARIKNECTKKCDDQLIKCYESSEYIEEYLEIRHQCHLDNADCFKICQIEEEKETPVVHPDCDPGMESCD